MGNKSTTNRAVRGRKNKALDAYRKLGTVVAACQAAGVGRRTWYWWRSEDPAFLEAVHEAEDAVADSLEQEAIRRAIDGSDLLLIFMLKSLKPAKFKDRRYTAAKHTGLDSIVKASGSTLGPPAQRG
jgi:hypothetical protein